MLRVILLLEKKEHVEGARYVVEYFAYELPSLLGLDVSGVIEEVGSGVTNFALGGVSFVILVGMDEEPLRTLRFLLARLERISADSVTAHRASGVRGAMLRAIDQLEKREQVPDYELKRLIESGYLLLQRAARERVS